MRQIFAPSPGEKHTADAVVIGGGIVGTATAFWLSRAGLKVIVVEMREGLSTLTTAASAECFRAQFTEPAMATIAKESIEFFENFAEVVGLPGYDIAIRQQGYLFCTDDPEMIDHVRAAVERHHQLGVTDSEFLRGEEVRARFPFISPEVVAATFRQRDGWLSCHEVTQGLAKGSQAVFFIKTRATDVLLDEKGVCGVETDRGSIQTRTVVNAAGPFAGQIGRMVGLELPLEPVRRQKVFVNVPLVPPEAPFTVDLINGSYWRPEAGGGLVGWVDPDEPVSEPLEQPTGDWDFPAIALDNVSRLTPFWSKVIEGLRKQDLTVSAGQYVYTPDEQPLLGPVKEVPGFHLNCGYWAGVMLSPVAGKWVADLITGQMDQ
ncbi:MAG: FAD-binding oxidoreductase, partial [Deltaproteobacteria bacterium]|nr:FAD-binding oxidoreductase [Deltaproteobacteria bacterium]